MSIYSTASPGIHSLLFEWYKIVFDGLAEVNKSINKNFETNLEIVTNGASLDKKGF